MHVDLISPYHGGSHKAWADGWQATSGHIVRIWGLPDRFWKWRMHGGAVTLARRWLAARGEMVPPEVILFTDMCDVTTFLALTRRETAGIPMVLYMHENQLTYPLPADGRTGPMRRQHGERDHHYVFINYASMLAADHVFFNSRYHLKSFFAALPKFLNHFPEYNEMGSVAVLREKSGVLPVGIELQRLAGVPSPPQEPPLILWNQRWEYDKNPALFFAALRTLAGEGVPFRLALCGQRYGRQPEAFTTGIEALAERIVHVGYADAETYKALLWAADVVISTAVHEFFGISMLEAIYCHTFPLLPTRLSYPELLPATSHVRCLYKTEAELVTKLRWALRERQAAREMAADLATHVQAYGWQKVAPQYDQLFSALLRRR